MSQFNYANSQNGVQGQHQPLTRLADLSTRPYQQDSPGPSQVLPPLHPQPAASALLPPFFKSNGSNPPSSRQNDFGAPPPQPGHPGPPGYMSSQPQMPMSVSQVYPPTASEQPTLHQQQTGHMNLQPNGTSAQMMPSAIGGPQGQPAFPAYGSHGHEFRNPDYRPLPVVGLQGRRGILPSAPGRNPIGSVLNGSARHTTSPMKNMEGKYPCPYCNKTYLHLKHLKRHQLRHTGERPYQCYLCSETFCRSDILKRHFTKCANRRGNPAGVGHLTHAQAHLKPAQSKPSSSSALSSASPSASNAPALSQPYRSQVQADHLQAPSALAHESGRSSSRDSSVARPESSSSNDDRNVAAHSNVLPPMNLPIDSFNLSSAQNGRMQTNERQFQSYGYARDPMSQPSYPDSQSGFYAASSSPGFPPVPANDQSNGASFIRGNLHPYADGAPSQAHPPDWSNYFPGGQEPFVFQSQTH